MSDYRIKLSSFGGIKDSSLGYKEGAQEAMKSFCNGKTYDALALRDTDIGADLGLFFVSRYSNQRM